jgi:hypothetical protein
LLVTSGACITPSQPHHEAVIVSPLTGMESCDPFDVILEMVIVPLPEKVTPVAVDPLRYIEPVAVIDHDELLPITVGVLNCRVAD